MNTKNKHEEKRPTVTIRYHNGDCVVEVRDKDNIMLLQQPVLDEDPYLYIARLREAIDGAQINEDPKLPDGLNLDVSEVPYVNAITRQIEELQRMRESMVKYFTALAAQGDDSERSFTENLT